METLNNNQWYDNVCCTVLQYDLIINNNKLLLLWSYTIKAISADKQIKSEGDKFPVGMFKIVPSCAWMHSLLRLFTFMLISVRIATPRVDRVKVLS